MTRNTLPSLAGITWLETLFSRRLGAIVTLEVEREQWVLRLPGSERRVRFQRCFQQIGLGQAPESCCHISAQDLVPGLEVLVAPGGTAANSSVTQDGADLVIGYDVPGLAFWALTRLEEIGRETVLDRHGRFPAAASHAARHGYLDRPIVDEWFVALTALVLPLWPELGTPKAPGLTIKPSHDVDTPTRYGFTTRKQLLRRMSGDLRRGAYFGDVIRAPLMRRSAEQELPTRDPANRFDWIMDQSEQAGLRSTFYFITRPHPNAEDPRYPFDSPALHRLLQEIHARGHDIGLHPSLNSFRAPERIRVEANHLREVCARIGVALERPGARMHYLQWRAESTPIALAAAGLHHDATLGYADQPGFRAGTCHAYHWFDVLSDRAIDLEMRPIIVMEQSLLAKAYLGLAPQDALDTGLTLMAAARRVGGIFSLLWHNDMLGTSTMRETYTGLLGDTRGDARPTQDPMW